MTTQKRSKEEILAKYPQSLDEVLHYHRTFVLKAMEEYASQFIQEIEALKNAIKRGDDLSFNLAFDGELSDKQKMQKEIEDLKEKLKYFKEQRLSDCENMNQQ